MSLLPDDVDFDSPWSCGDSYVERKLEVAASLERKIDELEADRDKLREIAYRLGVLATKWVDVTHHDCSEIKEIYKALEETP